MAETKKNSAETAPPLSRVLTRSILNPLNLAVAASSAGAAFALHLWPIGALGGAAYAALVAWDIFNPSFWKKALAAEPIKMPDSKDIRDPDARSAVESMKAAQKELDHALSSTSDEVKSHLAVVLASLSELQERAVHFVIRIEDLSAWLGRTKADPVRAEMRRLAEKVQQTRDEHARAQYKSALSAREDQLKAIDDIQNAKERAQANLSRLVATFEGMPAKIVRMRALDAQAMDELSGSLNDELGHINDEMKAFEETLSQLVEIARG